MDANNLASPIDQACMDAADLISQADGLLITAGAGMGIDSGMPDFRGEHGFWNAYPALRGHGMRFHQIANPAAFHSMPAVAWGFYGHRLRLYRDTAPHAGFHRLLALAAGMPNGAFVFTSNVDGHFQKAGFAPARVAECHGSINHLQCLANCGQAVWPADGFFPMVDTDACELTCPFPVCPSCGSIARPNIMMFGDDGYDGRRSDAQTERLQTWLARLQRAVVIEIGAGTAISTVRRFGEWTGWPLIRINPTESAVALKRDIAIPLGALEGIQRIEQAMKSLRRAAGSTD
jgi:NAD-dependent SIR2 family protein deacetylase